MSANGRCCSLSLSLESSSDIAVTSRGEAVVTPQTDNQGKPGMSRLSGEVDISTGWRIREVKGMM
jgi:hypothetical protein